MKDAIQKELKEISTIVAEMSNGSAFKAPENYFENFAEKVLQKAKSFGEIEKPLEISKINHFEVSESYFENFVNSIIGIVKSNQAADELNLLSKINHFEAPENYFEQLPDVILAQKKLIGEEENDLEEEEEEVDLDEGEFEVDKQGERFNGIIPELWRVD